MATETKAPKFPAGALLDKNGVVYTVHKVWDPKGIYTDKQFRRYNLVRKNLGLVTDF